MQGSDGVTIRPWQARDRAAVQTLLRVLDEEADQVLDGAMDVTYGAPAYVAERDGVVLGMVTLCVHTTLTGAKAYLDHLVVAPEARRSGIGRQLVQHAIERAREAGASRVDLTARASKRAAHALYRSLGFEVRETTNLRLRINPEET
ncbi:MAG TPA: GNAT family N-acetyltransferase [Baekduia sp.]|nr:GNAT family N-acetyltransferase [Baekduia sp.]